MTSLHTTKYNKGFTMIETLVAIFVLLISVTGPLAVAQSGLRAAYIARDTTTAYYLAQDAIEFVKNIRDDNFITAQANWLEYIDNCMFPDTCTVDTTVDTYSDGIDVCVAGGGSEAGCFADDPLNKNASTNLVGFTGEPTRFYRTVQIKDLVSNQEAQVIVKVGWTTAGDDPREIEVQENIFRWVQYD